MKVVGLDLSLTSTGVATIEGGQVEVDNVTSKGRKDATLAERDMRIAVLVGKIIGYAHAADLVVVEGPSFGQARQGGQHDRAGLWWRVVHAMSARTEVVEVAPSLVKKYATGKGNAAKDEVLLAVARRYPDVPVLNNDQADALVLAAMGARALGEPLLRKLPLLNTSALDKVSWPVGVVA